MGRFSVMAALLPIGATDAMMRRRFSPAAGALLA
jgi:hypothetical protein